MYVVAITALSQYGTLTLFYPFISLNPPFFASSGSFHLVSLSLQSGATCPCMVGLIIVSYETRQRTVPGPKCGKGNIHL